MLRNIGTVDRAIRIVVGIVLLSLVLIGPRTPLGYLGLVPLMTAVAGYCPLYGLLRISTCPRRPASG